MIWPFKRHPIPTKTMLVHGFEPCGDTQVYERFWLLVEYSNGKRQVETINGTIQPIHKAIDMSIYPRIRAWELNGTIAESLAIDLTKFDHSLERELME